MAGVFCAVRYIQTAPLDVKNLYFSYNMKYGLFILFTMISFNSAAQQKSDLYIKVVSIFKDSLGFDTSNFEKQTTINKRLKDVPLKTPAIIIKEGLTEPYRLNYATMKDVKSILVLQPPQAAGLLGPDGKFGAVIISGKKRLIRKLFPR